MRRPTIRCSGTGIFRRGRCAPANDRYGAVDRYTCPRGARTRAHSRRYSGASATCSMTACDNTRSNAPSGKGKRHAVGEREVQVAQAALAAEANARILEPLGRIDPDHGRCFLRERQRHAAPAAAGVEHAAADGHPRALEKRDDLRAPVVLEQRVVVFGAKPQVRVRFDRAVVNPAHARPSASHASLSKEVDFRESLIR